MGANNYWPDDQVLIHIGEGMWAGMWAPGKIHSVNMHSRGMGTMETEGAYTVAVEDKLLTDIPASRLILLKRGKLGEDLETAKCKQPEWHCEYERTERRRSYAAVANAVGVKRIIYNDPATVIFWTDGTKTIVKRAKGEKFSKYTAFCAALAKKLYGNNSVVRRIVESGFDQSKHEKKGKKKK